MRKKIEQQLQSMLNESDFGPYLQDDFFTLRSERYVVPIRLDGRGRIKGSILDTSASGQTLYVEPYSIAPLNEQMQELELADKLEVIKIYRELSIAIANDLDILQTNYKELIELDFLSAQAELALALNARAIKFSDTPVIELINVRHPLINRPDGKPAVANNINITETQKCLILSGPNAGGKTVILETLGIVHLMAKSGLMIPADEESKLYLFESIFIEIGDAQDLKENLSTFSGHLLGLKKILDSATSKDLVLLDELAIGTEPQTGSAIAQAILENLVERNITVAATTHYDNLKGLAVSNCKFRNGSMEYSIRDLKPTYKLILDIPGQSYGLEVAEDSGLDPQIIDRAKQLRGHTASALDLAISQLAEQQEKLRLQHQELENKILQAKAEEARWRKEVEAIAVTRKELASKLQDRYQDELSAMKLEFDQTIKKLREATKAKRDLSSQENPSFDSTTIKKQASQNMASFQSGLEKLNQEFDLEEQLPGAPLAFNKVQLGLSVYLIPLNKEGIVTKIGCSENDPIEVEVGALKMRVSIHDLRYIPKALEKQKSQKKLSLHFKKTNTEESEDKPSIPNLVIPTPRNTCDLRGLDLDSAKVKMWDFLDSAVLRGESSLVIIHGHGMDRLKNGLRDALKYNSPYELAFRPGNDQEGGTGVTIVSLSL
ncbi:MAG: Smr/MutS family protein [Bdellovibrionota bacterium]